MGRPDLSNVRRQQILDAFVWCVSRFGVVGATQQKIAEKAGVNRPILRHYLGNKDQLVESLVHHVIDCYDRQLQALKDSLPADSRVSVLVQHLFAPRRQSDIDLGLCYQALIVHCSDTPHRERLEDSMTQFISLIEQEIGREYPDASSDERRAATMIFLSLYLGAETLAPFSSHKQWLGWARLAADQQLSCLERKYK